MHHFKGYGDDFTVTAVKTMLKINTFSYIEGFWDDFIDTVEMASDEKSTPLPYNQGFRYDFTDKTETVVL